MVADPSEWRFKTPAGVPFRFMQLDGETTAMEGEIGVKVLIESRNILTFLREVYPPPIIIGQMVIPQIGLRVSGMPFLLPSRTTFSALDDGRPIDPFSSDLAAVEGTYGEFIEVNIQFSTLPYRQPDPNDPVTFLQVRTSQKDRVELRSDTSARSAWAYDDGRILKNRKSGTSHNVVRDPLIVWELTWPLVNYVYFFNVLRPRLKIAHGKVNSTIFPCLFNAPPQTLLLTRFDYEQHFDWLGTQAVRPSHVTVTIEMQEKNFNSKQVTFDGNNEPIFNVNNPIQRNWNSQWEDDIGAYLTWLPDGTNVKYESVDFNGIFAV